MVQPKKVKFSAMMKNEKEYEYDRDRTAEKSMDQFPEYKQKEGMDRIPFDPNIRHRLPEVPNHLMYQFMKGHAPIREPESQYVAVNHQGTTYHLFNAARMPVGRMAVIISQAIRGKNKPTYSTLDYHNGDKCIVINMAEPYFTGRKKKQKVYRHHTGYPGGLKEYTY